MSNSTSINNITTVAHTKGGVGKSIISWNLAYALRKKDKKVIIIDLDFQQTLFFASEIRKCHAKKEIRESGIQVMQVDNIEELIVLLHTEDVHIIIDVGGFDTDLNRTAITYADNILVPVGMETTEIIGLQTFKAILSELDTAKISLLRNNIHHAVTNYTEIIKALSDIEDSILLESVIRSSKAFDRAIARGLSVVEDSSKNSTLAAQQIMELADELYK